MQTPPSVPHGSWRELLPYVIFSFLAGSLGWVKVWLDRKKPDAEIHETQARTARTNAEARKLDAEASRDIGEIVVAMSAKITEAQQLYDEQRERHARQVEFFQRQVEIKTDSEQLARDRAHAALAEVQRCILIVRDYEERMRAAGIQVVPFEVKTYEEIMTEKKA